MNYYTGIGSRSAPNNILNFMMDLGYVLQESFILRSGGAPGCDLAFEHSVEARRKNIFLPWKGFNNNVSQLYAPSLKSFEIAEEYAPYWKNMKPAVRKLMARNVHQVLGMKLDSPSQFLVCWTPDGAIGKQTITKNTGGTGMAIRVAEAYQIPVYNLNNIETLELFKNQYHLNLK